MKKIIVDDNVCIGCGFCAASSNIFDLNDENVAYTKDKLNIIDNMDEEQKEETMDILEGCPVGAIKTEEVINED